MASNPTGIPTYAMLDLWQALGGTPAAFDRMWEEDRRTPADTWSQLLALVRGDSLDGDHNPPAGPEFDHVIGSSQARIRADERDRICKLLRHTYRPGVTDEHPAFIIEQHHKEKTG